jgi:acyl-CoA synthetase (NDP forming)
VEHSVTRGLGINIGLSVGNMMDVDMNDFLEYCMLDPQTQIIGFYLESLQTKAQQFLKLLKKVAVQKPVVILKGGTTARGAKSCLSHTGAIAGNADIYNAAFKQTGAIVVKDSIEFYDIAHFLSMLFPDHLPKGNKLCALVPGGGASVEISDLFTEAGAEFPDLSEPTQKKLRNLLQDVNTSFSNPIDTGAYGILPDFFLQTIKFIMTEKNVDLIVPILQVSRIQRLGTSYRTFAGSFARSLMRIVQKSSKPIILINKVDRELEDIIRENNKLKEILYEAKIPHIPSIPRLTNALSYLLQYSKFYFKKNPN